MGDGYSDFGKRDAVGNLIIFHDGIETSSSDGKFHDVERFREAIITVEIAEGSGDDRKLVPEIEISVDGSTWIHRATIIDTETEGDLRAVTEPIDNREYLRDNGTYVAYLQGNLGKYLRVRHIISGKSASFKVKTTGYFKAFL